MTGCLRESSPKPEADVAQESALEAKVRALIAAEPTLSDQPIDIEVKEGTLVLRGKVAREKQKEKATEVAARAGGDVPIQNKITVQRTEPAAGHRRSVFAAARFYPVYSA
ncbi:MAG: BON domain-containing protein [Candidatus Manganitrophus sp.]|nr:BON domain-containing protein [Candidatus Manganitrophus sp.]